MVVIKETVPALREIYGKSFISDVEKMSDVIGFSIEKENDEFRVEFNPDRPDLFSFSLLKRSIDIYQGKKEWQPIRVGEGTSDFNIENDVRSLRPYAIGFHCKGPRIGDHYRELIDYQEKLHLSIGKDRSKVSIGIHDERYLKFPLKYSSRKSGETRFTTYDKTLTASALDILKKHPKGVEYAHLIPSKDLVPIIEDSEHRVLSMPPVVNGSTTVVSEDTSAFFIDITGTDLRALKDAFFLLSYYFNSLDFEITESNIEDIRKFLNMDGREISVSMNEIKRILGQEIGIDECVTLLQKMGYGVRVEKVRIVAVVPGNRIDVMGPVDVIEDVAKAFGYGNLELHMPDMDIIGAEAAGNQLASNIRNIMTGLGYQEIMTYVVTTQENYRLAEYKGAVHIRNPKSLEFSMVRDRLYLGVLDFLRLNKRRNLPQAVFELGEIIIDAEQQTNLCVARIGSRSAFSDMKQVLDAIMTRTSLGEYIIRPTDHENFVNGRTGEIITMGQCIGYVGEIHPETIEQFELKNPVAMIEMNLSAVSSLLR